MFKIYFRTLLLLAVGQNAYAFRIDISVKVFCYCILILLSFFIWKSFFRQNLAEIQFCYNDVQFKMTYIIFELLVFCCKVSAFFNFLLELVVSRLRQRHFDKLNIICSVSLLLITLFYVNSTYITLSAAFEKTNLWHFLFYISFWQLNVNSRSRCVWFSLFCFWKIFK